MTKKINYSPRTQNHHRVSGFTMVEIIVVILIVSILLSTAIPSFLSVINRARCSVELNPNLIITEVEREKNVHGKIKGCEPFRKYKELRFYVHATGKTRYPYYYFPILIDGQDWKSQDWSSSVTFGEEQDSGATFKGGVVLIDPKDSKLLDYDADNGRNSLIGRTLSANDFSRE
jgi:prepilin-type N-terminal cleavage/methylation domain-containing protein